MEEVFPGNIFRIDTSTALPKITANLAYIKVPVRWSTPNNIGSYIGLPTFKNLQNYVKPLEDELSNVSSIGFSGWRQIYDYRVLYNVFGMEEDHDSFYKLFAIESQPKKIMDDKTVVVRYDDMRLTSVDVSSPRKTELILQNELDNLLSKGKDLYYISGIFYGYKSIFVLEGEEKEETLRLLIQNVMRNAKISAKEAKILDKCNLSVYLRTSSKRQPFVKQARGSEAISQLIQESNDQFKDIKGKFLYPISYYLRNLKNFRSFKCQFRNRAYFEK